MIHLKAEVEAIGYVVSQIKLDRKRNEKLMAARLQRCIEETTEILKIRDLLEKSCSFMIFVQHTLDTLMICNIVFIIPEVSIFSYYSYHYSHLCSVVGDSNHENCRIHNLCLLSDLPTAYRWNFLSGIHRGGKLQILKTCYTIIVAYSIIGSTLHDQLGRSNSRA